MPGSTPVGRPIVVLTAALTFGALAASGRASAQAVGGHAAGRGAAGGPPEAHRRTAVAIPNALAGRDTVPARRTDIPRAPGGHSPAAHKDRFPDPGAHPTVE